jgi:ribose 5-phosphate isomerase B
MKIYIASDHAAFHEKQALASYLKERYESTHYPEWAKKLALKVRADDAIGILLCGSGIGVSITANRFKGIRAALCRDEDDAKMGRLHNNANVLCLSGRKTSIEELKKISDAFLSTAFEGGRHQVRIDQFNHLGE